MIERSQGKTDRYPCLAVLRQRGERRSEARILEPHAVDVDHDRALIVAKTLERGGQAVHVASPARDQAKRTDGRRGAQGSKIGSGFKGIVDIAIPGRGDVHPVRLWVRRLSNGTKRRETKQNDESQHTQSRRPTKKRIK